MKRWLVVTGVSLAVVALLVVGLIVGSLFGGRSAVWHSPGSMMGSGYGSWFGMHSFGGGILMLLFWGVVIGGLALLAWGLVGRQNKPADASQEALEILKRRYALGEINHEEFQRMRESLIY